MTDFTKETVEGVFTRSGKHIVAAFDAPEVRLLEAEVVCPWARLSLALDEVMNDFKTGFPALLGGHCRGTRRGSAFPKIFEQGLGVVPLLALGALYSGSEGSPLVALILWLFQKFGQEIPFCWTIGTLTLST